MAYETLKVGNKKIVLTTTYTINGGSIDCHKVIKGKIKNKAIKKIAAVNNSVVKLETTFNDYYIKITGDSLNIGFKQNYGSWILLLCIGGAISFIPFVGFTLLAMLVDPFFTLFAGIGFIFFMGFMIYYSFAPIIERKKIFQDIYDCF